MLARWCSALLVGLVSALLASLGLVYPSEADPRRAPGSALSIDPAAPSVGERPRVSGRAPGPPGRLVRLQTRRADGTWRSIARRATRADRSFTFRLDAVSAQPRRFRVQAPRTADRRAWRSKTLVVRGRTPTSEPPAVRGVPRVDIATVDGEPVSSKTAYQRATLTLDPRGADVPAYTDSVRLRVRGNFTAYALEKLPYKLKLDKDQPLLGLAESKDWVLLANYFDRSLLRTTLGMEISERLGRPWTPHFVDVEVWLNGVYKGLYQLGEGVEVQQGRLELELDEDEDSPQGGGWTLEADKNPEDDPVFTTDRGLQVYVTEPGVDQDYADEVGAWVQELEDVLYSPGFTDPATGYAAYLHVGSFIDWYLVMELMKTLDAGFNNSIKMQRTVGGRLEMGPVWDFDLSSGNRLQWHNDDPEGWFIRTNWFGRPESEGYFPASQMNHEEGHWLYRLFQDPAFEQAVEDRWGQVREELLTLPAFLEERRRLIAGAAERNFAPVSAGGAGHPLGASPYDSETHAVFHPTYAASAGALHAWLTARLAWMDAQLT